MKIIKKIKAIFTKNNTATVTVTRRELTEAEKNLIEDKVRTYQASYDMQRLKIRDNVAYAYVSQMFKETLQDAYAYN